MHPDTRTSSCLLNASLDYAGFCLQSFVLRGAWKGWNADNTAPSPGMTESSFVKGWQCETRRSSKKYKRLVKFSSPKSASHPLEVSCAQSQIPLHSPSCVVRRRSYLSMIWRSLSLHRSETAHESKSRSVRPSLSNGLLTSSLDLGIVVSVKDWEWTWMCSGWDRSSAATQRNTSANFVFRFRAMGSLVELMIFMGRHRSPYIGVTKDKILISEVGGHKYF